MVLIFWLSAQPDLDTGLGVWDTILRKAGHATEFGVLTLLWYWALRPTVERPLPLAAAIALLYAVSDEYHQSLVESRAGTPIDVGIDAAGILIAFLLFRYDARVRSALHGGEER
jgi:VanZ family protein